MPSLIGNTNGENGQLFNQGTENATRSGVSRSRVFDRPGFEKEFELVYGYLHSGDVTAKDAAKYLGIGTTTLRRLVRQTKNSDQHGLRQHQSDSVNA